MRWAAIALLMVLAGCRCAPGGRHGPGASGCERQDDDVRVIVSALPRTLDNSRSSPSSADNAPVLLATQRGLTTLDSDGRPGPGLALSWEVDRATEAPHELYTFHLDPNVVWSDGVTPFTARDFVFGWRRALLGNEPAELLDLVGAREVLQLRERAGAPSELTRAMDRLAVTAVDAHTLRVTLVGTRGYFLSRLANVYTFFPQPSALLEERSEEETARSFTPDGVHPLALGAFRVVSWDRLGRTMRLEPNPHGPTRTNVRSVLLAEAPLGPVLYDQCKADFLLADDPSLLKTPPADLRRSALTSSYWLGMNASLLPLALRRAIALTIDREALLSPLLPQPRLAATYLPPNVTGRVAPMSRPDREAARALVASVPVDSRRLTLLVRATRTFLPEKAIADGLRRQLGNVGLEVRVVETSDFPADIQDLGGRSRHPLFLKRVGADYLHAHSLLSPFLESGLHYTGFREIDDGEAGRRFSALVDRAAATDGDEARALYAQADDLLVREFAVVFPLFHPDRFHRVRPWVEGLGVDPFNFLTLRDLRLAPRGP